MKTILRILSGAALLGFTPLTAHLAQAQTTVESTTVAPVAGTISAFSPDVITVRTDAATPLTYHYTKSTTYVDETGAPVSVETVKSGLPVTVYYTKEGDDMIASKVIVRKTTTTAPAAVEEKTSTTTTTTEER